MSFKPSEADEVIFYAPQFLYYFKGHCNGLALGCHNVSILQTMYEPYALRIVYRDIILHFNSFSSQKNEFDRTGNGSGPANTIWSCEAYAEGNIWRERNPKDMEIGR